MAGFGKAFDETFKTGYASGAATSLELIKEKIKESQAKADEKYKADTLMNANIAMATEFGDPEIAKKVTLIAEKAGSSSEAQKAIGEFTSKFLQDRIRQANRPSLKPQQAITFDPVTGTYADQSGNKVSEISPAQPIRNKALPAEFAAEKAGAVGVATGEAGISTEQKKIGIKLGALGKKLNTLRKQYDAALPDSGVNSETSQRIIGTLDVLAAKTGVKPNPKLVALQKNKRLQAIQIIKMAGESGNLAEQEQAGAIESIESEKLTSQERKESVKQFMEVALAGSSDEALNYLMKDKNFVSFLDEVGFDYETAGIKNPSGSNDESILKGFGLDPSKFEIVR